MIEQTINIIDLFAGVGGIRLGFEQAAHEFHLNTQCVFTSEIDDWACATYRKRAPPCLHEAEPSFYMCACAFGTCIRRGA